MQGTKIRLLAGGLLLVAAACHARADLLQPDPAWQQGKLDNGFQWQVLATPQRPSDRVEVRLIVNAGSLTESTQQSGYSHLLSRLALSQSGGLSSLQARSLWQQSKDPERPLPPVITSYDFTQFNLSLPNDRGDLLKEALNWLAASAGSLSVTPETVDTALQTRDAVATWPMDTKDSWWRYRLKGSSLLGHDPAEALKHPLDVQQLKAFYHKWYTPDAMTLIVVGNVDSRGTAEQIAKTFGYLRGKREAPAPVPTLSPLSYEPVSLMTDSVHRDRLSLMWDNGWQPIRESGELLRYWRADLAREALFWNIQQNLSKNDPKDLNLSFECRVLYQRAQCGINIESPNDKLNANLTSVGKELMRVRDHGLSQEEFDALIAQKKDELARLFATYARTDTDILISQRMHSLQNQVVDIAPEQYQQLRQEFLDNLTLSMMNQDLRQQLSQEMSLVLLQPKGEPEYNMKELQAMWEKVMTPPAPPPPTDDPKQNVSDIPPVS